MASPPLDQDRYLTAVRPSDDRAGWPTNEWCASVGISRTTFYALDEPPESITIGRKRLILESPHSFLKRIAETQREAA